MSDRKPTYRELLKDCRWQEFRLLLLTEANWTCEECGIIRPTNGLQVHHVAYLPGVMPWEYPRSILMVLCESCHVTRQQFEGEFMTKVAGVIRHKCIAELKTFPIWYMFEPSQEQRKDRQP